MGKPSARQRATLERRALLAARAFVDRTRTLYRELERLTGAPIAVHRALACIGADPGITASKLALALGMQRPALSHVLRGVVERRWVERVRSDADQRSVRLFLTAGGRELLGATAG
ncbi:MAG TPA: MarR family transcriptional regulator, partial [Steroidobacteraceae bacterium]